VLGCWLTDDKSVPALLLLAPVDGCSAALSWERIFVGSNFALPLPVSVDDCSAVLSREKIFVGVNFALLLLVSVDDCSAALSRERTFVGFDFAVLTQLGEIWKRETIDTLHTFVPLLRLCPPGGAIEYLLFPPLDADSSLSIGVTIHKPNKSSKIGRYDLEGRGCVKKIDAVHSIISRGSICCSSYIC
jgi:hypothetical protein